MHLLRSRMKYDNKLYRSYLLSYASVLLLPIIICSFYYYHSYSTSKDHAIHTQYLAQQNLGDQINSALTDTVNLGSHLKLNPYATALSKGRATLNSSPSMDRYYLKKDLASLLVSNRMIQEINIYFLSDHYVVNSSTAYEKELLSSMEPSNSRVSSSDWKALENSLKEQTYCCYSTKNNTSLLIGETLFTDGSGAPSAILCIQLDKKQLLDRLQSQFSLSYPCDFMLIDDTSILLSTDHLSKDTLSIPAIHDYFMVHSDNALYETDGASPLVISYLPLQFTETALITSAQKSEYTSSLKHLLAFMFFTIMICILSGTIIIMYFSQRNYEPVSDIIQYISRNENETCCIEDEYHLIMQTLMENHTQIKRQHDILKNDYLEKILLGEIAPDTVPEQIADQFSFHFYASDFCIVILSIDHAGCFENTNDVSTITSFTIRNVYQELLAEQFPDCQFMSQKSSVAVLIPITPDYQKEGLHLIELYTEKLLSFLADSFQLELRAGISMIQPKDQIAAAYLQAQNALEYQQIFAAKNICTYASLPQVKNIGAVSLNSVDYVTNLILQNSQGQLSSYFSALKQELSTYELSWNDAKTFFYFFYQITSKVQLFCKSNYDLTVEALESFDHSFFMQPLSATLNETCSAYLAASSEIAAEQAQKEQEIWGKDICQFIENNYFNSNINLNTIAEQFHISPSYLSKKFREHYAKSIIDYLYDIRIENSLALLEDTDLRIADIAQMTGFIDSNAFIRIFKKLKGITPGKYKAQMDV